MAKSIIKELIIVLLLCLAIILIFAILLYEYVPMSKTLPNQVAYTTPENVKQDLLTASDVDESQIVMTYEVNSDDLNNYTRINNYNPGKANPFSSYETQTSESTTATNGTTSNNGGTTSSSNTTTSSGGSNNSNSVAQENSNTTTSGGSYFQDKGTK